MTSRPKRSTKTSAKSSTAQLSLELPTTPALGRSDFLEAPSNAVALGTIEAPDGLPAGLLLIVGPEGSGKTHLAHIWSQRVQAHWVSPAQLHTHIDALLDNDARPPLVLDEADGVAGTANEEALFHLVNHYRGQGELLLTARAPARDWGLRLPDLITRLNASAHVTLSQPDEALLAAVLVKLFSDRQLLVQPALIDYLLTRMERSLASARSLVAQLDERALQLSRPITRSLAREVLDAADAAQEKTL